MNPHVNAQSPTSATVRSVSGGAVSLGSERETEPMPNRPPHPCQTCGTPTPANRPRCPTCEQARNLRRTHYHGDYPSRAAQVRTAANTDPATRCRRCGQPARPGDPWQAGHVIDGDPRSPLAPEHASCNAAAGGRGGRDP